MFPQLRQRGWNLYHIEGLHQSNQPIITPNQEHKVDAQSIHQDYHHPYPAGQVYYNSRSQTETTL